MNLHFLTATANKNGSDGVFRRTRIMLSMSGRFLPPQAEDEDDEAAETEQDADDDAVCRSIRPTMTGRAHRRPRRSPNRQAAARGRKDREEAAREDETARHTGREREEGRGDIFCVFMRRPRLSCGCVTFTKIVQNRGKLLLSVLFVR
jgi:hypothetical protein